MLLESFVNMDFKISLLRTGGDTIYEKLLKESKKLEGMISDIEEKIMYFPKGKLYIINNGKYSSWYHSHNKTKRYIAKSDKAVAEKLAKKTYYSYLLQDLKDEKKATDLFLMNFPKIKKSEEYINNKGARELLASEFTHISQELNDWAHDNFETNPYKKEYLTYECVSGNVVRSKSESIIDMMLYMNRIPYRYEAALQLGNKKIYPDFTIRHPRTGEIYYWEHFGLMDEQKYNEKVGPKLDLYIKNGIIPTINLITTYETSDNPLTSKQIEKVINDYFS